MNNHTCTIGMATYSFVGGSGSFTHEITLGSYFIEDDADDWVNKDIANSPLLGRLKIEWVWFKFCPNCGAPQPIGDRRKY